MVSQSFPTYAGVVVAVSARAVDRPFTYGVPTELASSVKLGCVVEIPFGPRNIAGFVVSLQDQLPENAEGYNIRPITKLLDNVPFIQKDLFSIAAFMRSYYTSSWISSLSCVIPGPVIRKIKTAITQVRPRKKTPVDPSIHNSFCYPQLTPTSQQEKAIEAIRQSRITHKPVLLFGVTGSGKTEVYLQAIDQVLKEGKKAIVLVPEVSLTPQAVERYRGRLGDTVGVLHSSLSDKDRLNCWMALRQGSLNVVLGTRSAIFAPMEDIGLIVIDEEHENSYKQDSSPRYHARQVAYKRAQGAECGLCLGSATPSLETFYLAQNGFYSLAEMDKRPMGSTLPQVSLVDLRRSQNRRKLISPLLAEKIKERVNDHEQVVLLLNRRGYSRFVQCKDCGFVQTCKNCSLALTFHKIDKSMKCHLCGYAEPPIDTCPICKGYNIDSKSSGTEKLLSEVCALIPGVKAARMDRDTTGKKDSYRDILEDFAQGNSQILLGTKMIAKGLDYPNVTLVGVIDADSELNFPDFRATEHCFQLLSQVAGRSGRGSIPGEVILQTYNPELPLFSAVTHHDYRKMYHEELALRKELIYPPFCRLTRIILSSKDEELVQEKAYYAYNRFCQLLSQEQVLGPSPCLIEKALGRFRWNILLKGKDALQLISASLTVERELLNSKEQDLSSPSRNTNNKLAEHSKLQVVIDNEPQSFT